MLESGKNARPVSYTEESHTVKKADDPAIVTLPDRFNTGLAMITV